MASIPLWSGVNEWEWQIWAVTEPARGRGSFFSYYGVSFHVSTSHNVVDGRQRVGVCVYRLATGCTK